MVDQLVTAFMLFGFIKDALLIFLMGYIYLKSQEKQSFQEKLMEKLWEKADEYVFTKTKEDQLKNIPKESETTPLIYENIQSEDEDSSESDIITEDDVIKLKNK